MKHTLSTNTEHALQIVNSIIESIDDSHHWIGDNSIRLDRQETKTFIEQKLPQQKHLKVRQYENRVCVELGLSGRNCLHIDLR